MRYLWPAWAAACTGGPQSVGLATGDVHIAVGATRPTLEEGQVDRLEVSLEELIVRSVSPVGDESVGVLVDYTFRPLQETDAFGFDLARGLHERVQLEFLFGWPDEPAVQLEGSLDDDDDEGQFRLEVDELSLSFEVGELEVGPEPRALRLQLEPELWLQALGLQDDDDSLVVDPSSGPLYDALVQSILSTTTLATGQTP